MDCQGHLLACHHPCCARQVVYLPYQADAVLLLEDCWSLQGSINPDGVDEALQMLLINTVHPLSHSYNYIESRMVKFTIKCMRWWVVPSKDILCCKVDGNLG